MLGNEFPLRLQGRTPLITNPPTSAAHLLMPNIGPAVKALDHVALGTGEGGVF